MFNLFLLEQCLQLNYSRKSHLFADKSRKATDVVIDIFFFISSQKYYEYITNTLNYKKKLLIMFINFAIFSSSSS